MYDSKYNHVLVATEPGQLWGMKQYPAAYLEHSCDEWVIGGKAQVQALIEDLQKVLDKL